MSPKNKLAGVSPENKLVVYALFSSLGNMGADPRFLGASCHV